MKKLLCCWLVLFQLVACSGAKDEPDSPNIILMMSDDQGWGDAGYNGHPELKTPTLDDMAANGVIFSRFYAASAVCSPTRGSVLTGRHPDRYGVCSANCGHLPDEEITLAEVAKEAGYRTGHFGKWHLGTLTRDTMDANRGGREENHVHYAPPWEHGFDVCFSTESKVPTWDPMIVPHKSAGDVKPQLKEGASFGTYYWTGPGKIATDNLGGDDSRVIMDRVIPFIEKSVYNDQPFFTVIWFHSPHLPVLTGEQYAQQYLGLTEDQQQYYGTITAMDEQIGRLRIRLRELNVDRNTVIFFTSDNGPEGRSVGGRTQGLTNGLKGRKRSLHEGGIRVPGLMEWPGTLDHVVIDEPCYTSDYFPTVSRLIGHKVNNMPIDGLDLMSFIHKPKEAVDRNLVFSFNEQVAVVNNQYKIYSNDQGSTFNFYDLLNDPGESYDASSAYEEVKQEMIQHWKSWSMSVDASISGADY